MIVQTNLLGLLLLLRVDLRGNQTPSQGLEEANRPHHPECPGAESRSGPRSR